MLIVGHTAIGVATGLLIPNPAAAFGVGVVSHHLADWVPHYDPGSYYTEQAWKVRGPRDYHPRDWLIVGIDVVLTLVMLILFLPYLPPDRSSAIVAGVVGANLPDLVHNVPFWGPQMRRVDWIRWWQDAIHRRFQTTVPARLWYAGLATQVVTIGLVAWLVLSAA